MNRSVLNVMVRRLPFVVRTLAASVVLFAVGVGVQETRAEAATAQIEIQLFNNTQAPWAYQSTGGFNDEVWLPAGTVLNTGTVVGWTGPPAKINPGETYTIAAACSQGAAPGTGGTIFYAINPLPQTDSHGNQIPPPVVSVGFYWSAPGDSLPPFDGIDGAYFDSRPDITFCTVGAVGQNICNTGQTEDVFVGGTYTNGYIAQFNINQTPVAPTSMPPASMTGYGGTLVTIDGSGFDTNGYTTVTFGSTPASVSCPSSTQCMTIAPPGSGVVPVTLDVLGAKANIGNFLYLPTSTCGFGASPTTIGTVAVSCSPNAAQRPIQIYQQTPSGTWNYIFNYQIPYYALGGQVMQTGLPIGTTETLLGCIWNPSLFPGVSPTPGMYGCDRTPTTIIITPPAPPPPPPPCVPLTCGSIANLCGSVPDECGGTLSCGGCASGNTCESTGDFTQCVCTTLACQATACVDGGGVWTGKICKHPVTNCGGKPCI